MGSGLKLKSEALSVNEWNYILGLFLADGYSDIRRTRRGWIHLYRVRFSLQGNEIEIAYKLINFLRRAGLNPHIDRELNKDLITVRTYSKALLYFLPDKEILKGDGGACKRFLDEYDLFNIQLGIPFLAGFLDGDGACGISLIKRRFKSMSMVWSFSQTSLQFLVNYIVKFVGLLAPGGVKIGVRFRKGGRKEASGKFHKEAMDALLKAGIAGYSWKVAQCLKEVADFHRELDDYYTVGEAALALKVNPWVVRRMVDAKEIECSRAEKMGRIISGSRRYIKIREVERIKAELDCRRAENDAAKRKGLKLTILARSLGVSRAALEWLRLKGKLRATLVRDDHGRGSTYLVVPWDEVERLKERKVKRR